MPPYAARWALFLDIDGTLLDIADTPCAVEPGCRELALVDALSLAAEGALALISGRTLGSIDRLFAPLHLPAAGQHGFERRSADGRRRRHRFPAERLRPVAAELREFAAEHPGVVVEDKGTSLALHYRLAPGLGEAAHDALAEAAAPLGALVEMQAGKMVWELKPAGADKGMAIAEFMAEPPFAGRLPVFLGDDVTDEEGFRVVAAAGGHGVKVGEGESAARWRLPDPAAARAWLHGWIDAMAAPGRRGSGTGP
jgi:trehalose 6-phosphate phosphatase